MPPAVRGLILWLCVSVAGYMAVAQTNAYSPDMMTFDGRRTIAVPSDEAFAVEGEETIEFWVGPDWTTDPGYDPVVVSNVGRNGASYVIAILRDRDGVGVLSGGVETLAPFDFTDGRLHHVAVVQSDGALHIIVDGDVRGTSSAGLSAQPAGGVWIASADGRTAPFLGAIGQLRFWNAAVDLETLDAFKLVDVLSDDGPDHPYTSVLAAVSAFPDPGMLIANRQEELSR
jgi:hypothetical protein